MDVNSIEKIKTGSILPVRVPKGTFSNFIKASKGKIDIYKNAKHTISKIPLCIY